ncbi:vWA domain-containing protein [Lysobacter brunescens]|uniref:VWA domain-containing protein n=1 Tax=Lysobacter brunescens TaxID=262323 RepID=A0ABW2YGZ6_9GAMM
MTLAELFAPLFAAFAWPWLLLALPLPWLARRVLPGRDAGAPGLRVPYGDRLGALAGNTGPVRARGIPALAWLAWCLLVVAAARPQQLGDVVQPPQTGRDLMLAVDLSGSMEERDIELGGRVVSRLTAGKAVIADFLERRAGDRVGLIVFGERAYALTPLTRDLDTVREQLDGTVTRLAGGGTAIGDAIALATKRLRKQPPGQRVLILLTDGVNSAGILDPLKAAELARDDGVRIHTIAFGGYGAGLSVFGVPIRMPGQAQQTDETTLQRIAQTTGGRAFVARDVDQLLGIYADIDRIEPVKHPGLRLRPRIERFAWPLAGALLCAALMLLLGAAGQAGVRVPGRASR